MEKKLVYATVVVNMYKSAFCEQHKVTVNDFDHVQIIAGSTVRYRLRV